MASVRIESIDFLRGYAALIVCFYHLSYQGTLFSDGWLREILEHGAVGVPIFFVITGFVIPWSLLSGGYTNRKFFVFLKKRLIRLEPPYVLSILVAILFWEFFGFHVGKQLNVGVENLSLHIGYLVGFAVELGMDVDWYIPVFWTLQFEFQFYLFAALCFTVLSSKNRFVRWLFVAGFMGIKFMIFGSSDVNSVPLFFRFADLFLFGIVIFWRKCGLVGNLEFMVFSGGALLSIASENISFLVYGPLICLLILKVNVSTLITRELGNLSYSLYLFHSIIGLWLLGVLLNKIGVQPHWAFMLSVFGATSFAYVISITIEQPSVRLSKALQYK